MDEAEIRSALGRAEAARTAELEVLCGAPRDDASGVGVVSGSFDPPTVAHVALAGALLAEGADAVLLVFSPRTLPKEAGPGGRPEAPLLSPVDRVRALLALCRARAGLGAAVSSHGLLVDQAEAARRRFPRSDLVFGLGSDKLVQLFDPSWYGDRDAALERLFRIVRVAYAPREEDEEVAAAVLERERTWRDRIALLALPAELRGVSSRSVRRALEAGRDVLGLIPDEIRALLPLG